MITKILILTKKLFQLLFGIFILLLILGFISEKLFTKKITMSCHGSESQILTNKKDEVSTNKNEKIISLSITFYNYPFLKPDATIDPEWGDYYYSAEDESRSVEVFPHSLIAHSKYNDGRYTYFNLDRISRKVFIEKSYDIRDDEKKAAYMKRFSINSSHEVFEGICEESKPI